MFVVRATGVYAQPWTIRHMLFLMLAKKSPTYRRNLATEAGDLITTRGGDVLARARYRGRGSPVHQIRRIKWLDDMNGSATSTGVLSSPQKSKASDKPTGNHSERYPQRVLCRNLFTCQTANAYYRISLVFANTIYHHQYRSYYG